VTHSQTLCVDWGLIIHSMNFHRPHQFVDSHFRPDKNPINLPTAGHHTLIERLGFIISAVKNHHFCLMYNRTANKSISRQLAAITTVFVSRFCFPKFRTDDVLSDNTEDESSDPVHPHRHATAPTHSHNIFSTSNSSE
jgi:hypothetical protein